MVIKKDNDIKIRFAIISDACNIAKIHVNSWQTIYRGLIPDNILDNLSINEKEKLWKSLLENNAPVLVLEKNNKLIGFLSYCPSRDHDANPKITAEISAIYLNPSDWGKGFGKSLCNNAISEMKKSGFKEISLWVLEENKQARYFYEKMGFIDTSEIKIDNENGYTFHEIKYKKLLKEN